MSNTAESQHLSVELIAIAEDVAITVDELFDEDETVRSTLLFFHVTNTSEEPIEWWYDEHYFIGSDGFQYRPGTNVKRELNGPADALPPHWYPQPTIYPGRTTRTVAEIAAFPNAVSVEEIIYDFEGDHYEITVENSSLAEPP